MTCLICSEEMIEAKATDFGKPYWYCRKCKKELSEMQPKLEPVQTPAKAEPKKPCAHNFDKASIFCTKCGVSWFAIPIDDNPTIPGILGSNPIISTPVPGKITTYTDRYGLATPQCPHTSVWSYNNTSTCSGCGLSWVA